MSAIKDMSKYLSALKPTQAEKKIIAKVIKYCDKLHAEEKHLNNIMHKTGLTQ